MSAPHRATWQLSYGLAFVALLGCETLLDLGPRARPQVDDAGGTAHCGFAVTSTACQRCLESQCCEENLACSGDSTCSAQQAQLTSCIYDVPCIQSVIADAGISSPLVEFSTCATNCTVDCFPTGECLQLAACCQSLGSVVRAGCSETVESADQARCSEARTTFDCP